MLFHFLAVADSAALSIREMLPVVLGLVLIEGLLSVDNALAIAAMAAHLPAERRSVAMNLGYAGAYGFRVLALVFASQIIDHAWVKLAGALYLLWLMCDHFAGHSEHHEDVEGGKRLGHRGLAGTILMIAVMDLSLSVDNVVAAIALSPNNLWPVYAGVTIGIVCLRLAAGLAVKLIQRYPVLEHTAFLLVGYVGILLLVELSSGLALHKLAKFAGILIITGLSLVYSASAGFRAAVDPVLRVARPPMKLVSAIFGGLFRIIGWPVKRLLACWTRD